MADESPEQLPVRKNPCMIKIGSRHEKPKLYSILALTGLMVFLLVCFLRLGAGAHAVEIGMLFSIYFLLVFLLLVRAFVHQLEYNMYSYYVIYYSGFALFVLSVLVGNLALIMPAVWNTDQFTARELIVSLMNSARTWMILSAPYMHVFAAALFVSNVVLLRHEGGRFKNLLGMFLSVFMVAGWWVLYRFDVLFRYESGSLGRAMVLNILSAFYLYLECLLAGTMIAGAVAASYEPPCDRDFMIILGCGIRKDGSPTPLLKGRIERALAFARKQKQTAGKELFFVTSGGKGGDEIISESESMKRYLMAHGIPEDHIISEDQSTDTLENMTFSREKIQEWNPDGKTAFSTTNYHVFRSGGLARKAKLYAYGVGADTRWYFWPNAAVRELVGLLAERPLRQLVVLVSMIAVFVVLTLAVYL